MAYAPMELVVAVSENDVIGRGNQLPWRLPADLRHFKLLTMGRSILMGRKTYESIGKALPGRTNIVLSRSPGFSPKDCSVVSTLEDARSAAATQSPLMVIGGAEIYRLCMPQADRIHLTLVHARIDDGDAFFSDWRAVRWHESSRDRFDADEKNPHPYSFITLDRDNSR
jgi:dihydrofolate reductase